MPTLPDTPERQGTIDERSGQYLCFPDILTRQDGTLLCVYREADSHVATRRRLLARMSSDAGHTWGSATVVAQGQGHCPRLSNPEPGLIAIADDNGTLHTSTDQGQSWVFTKGTGIRHGVTDRILAMPDGSWLTTAHRHLELPADPASGQRPTEQIVFASHDQGRNWHHLGTLAGPGRLVLCEAALTPLPDGRLLALMRENSHVGEPVYRSESLDGGRSWSPPAPTPLVGHRPTPGLTKDGRLLVTFRDTGPSCGTSAWLGSAQDLAGFSVHGSRTHLPHPLYPDPTPEGLLLDPAGGPPPFYLLAPLTDPDRETATLQAEVRCLDEAGGCGLRLGGWWRIQRDQLTLLTPPRDGEPQALDAAPLVEITLPRDQLNHIRLHWAPGLVHASVNGEHCAAVELDASSVRRRPILFGALPFGNAGRSLWRMVRHDIYRQGRDHHWQWHHEDGPPDAHARRDVLQLAAAPDAAWCDYGYTGWTETTPGEFLCAYHHATGHEPGYAPGSHAHVRSTRFQASDFDAASP